MKLSVIVPCYNEQRTIITLLEQVHAQRRAELELQVIVVDDGSSDGSAELVAARPELFDRHIRLGRNRGKGGAVIAGLEAADGDFVLFQDADLEYDPSAYAQLVYPVRQFDAEVVMGSRLMAPPYTRVHYFWHKVGNRLITLLFNVLNNTTFTDVYSCYLLYRRALIDPAELRTVGWEQHAEILSRLARRARVIYEVPITYAGRSYGEGKKIKAHHVFVVVWTMIRERFAPGRASRRAGDA
jgi:glycosyltransferase involved in cell wall biosynthesis